jgi:hypothetical protein
MMPLGKVTITHFDSRPAGFRNRTNDCRTGAESVSIAGRKD